MRVRTLLVSCLLTAVSGCSIDHSITHGADGSPEWDRRLSAAIPLGLAADSARAVMIRNGFRCSSGADSVRYLWCDKESGPRFAVVRRRWQAILNIDDRGRIYELRGTTG